MKLILAMDLWFLATFVWGAEFSSGRGQDYSGLPAVIRNTEAERGSLIKFNTAIDAAAALNRHIPRNKPTNTLRLLTWNVNNLILPDLVTEAIKAVDPDVIVLQECPGPERNQVFQAFFANLPNYRLYKSNDAMGGGGNKYFVATLIKSDIHAVHYKLATTDHRHRMIGVRIGNVVVVGLHSYYQPGEGMKQSYEADLTKIAMADDSLIFAGDFNLSSIKAAAILNQSISTDQYRDAFGLNLPPWTGSGNSAPDHVFIRSSFVVRGAYVYYVHGSDHVPLIVDLASEFS